MSALFTDAQWYELLRPGWLIFVILLGYWYTKHIVQSKDHTVSRYRRQLFYTALVLIYILNGSPFSVIANQYIFSGLMLQITITLFVLIPLLIIGLPITFFRQYAWNHKRRLSMKIAGHPWVTLIIFSAVFTIYFMPGVFNVVHDSFILSFLAKAVLMIYAFFMWWVIINPLPGLNELSYLTRIGYIFLISVLLMPIGFFLIVVQDPHYPVYTAAAGDILPFLTIIYDQQFAGGILKLIQLSSFIFAMFQILKKWGREEDAHEGDPNDDNIRVVQGIPIRVNHKK